MNNRWKNFLNVVIGIIIGIALDMMIDTAQTPNCPQEDSCYPDYYNGSWHIIEGSRNGE